MNYYWYSRRSKKRNTRVARRMTKHKRYKFFFFFARPVKRDTIFIRVLNNIVSTMIYNFGLRVLYNNNNNYRLPSEGSPSQPFHSNRKLHPTRCLLMSNCRTPLCTRRKLRTLVYIITIITTLFRIFGRRH